MIVNVSVILFLKLKLLWIFEAKISPNILSMSRVHNSHLFKLLFTPRLSTQDHNTCYGAIGSNVIKIIVPYRAMMGSCLGIGAPTIVKEFISMHSRLS